MSSGYLIWRNGGSLLMGGNHAALFSTEEAASEWIQLHEEEYPNSTFEIVEKRDNADPDDSGTAEDCNRTV